MKITQEEKDAIKEIIAKKFILDFSEVEDSDYLESNYGMDSLDAIELIMEIEQQFNINIPDSDVENVEKVSDIYVVFEKYKYVKDLDLSKMMSMVAEFQIATDQPVSSVQNLGDLKNNNLRYELMSEENTEYFSATINRNTTEILDGCVDMMYILLGTINQHGFQNEFAEAFSRVHLNNMSKVGPDGKVKRNEQGKILKPEGFDPVDLSDLIKI